MTFITPKASDTPIAIRNSTSPNCSPLNPCSSRSPDVTSLQRASFHPTLGSEIVGPVVQDGPGQLDVKAAVGALVHHTGVVVLDRLVVVVELERPAHALEVGLLQRRAKGVLVL